MQNKQKNSLENIVSLERDLQDVITEIGKIAANTTNISTPQSLENLEGSLRKLFNRQSDLIAAILLQHSLIKAESDGEIKKLAKSMPYKLKNYGPRTVKVRMAGGTEVTLVIFYYARPCKEKKRYAGVVSCPAACWHL